MNKKLKKLTVSLLACGMLLTTSAPAAFAAPKCEVKTKIVYFNPIKAQKEQNSDILLWLVGQLTRFDIPKKAQRGITEFSSIAGFPEEKDITTKPTKYRITVKKCLDYEKLKKHPFTASIGYVKADVKNLKTGKVKQWYYHNVGWNPILVK